MIHINEVKIWEGKALPDYTTTTIIVDVHGQLIGTCNIWKKGDELYADLSLHKSFNPASYRLYPNADIRSSRGFKNGLIVKVEIVEVHDQATDLDYFNFKR